MEGGHRSILFPSGPSACSHALLGIVKAADHVLISDSVYGPVRIFADQVLTRFQVKIEYFYPTQSSDLLAKIRSNTRAVYLESPGSMTFEVQDLVPMQTFVEQQCRTRNESWPKLNISVCWCRI
ncbi:PLP-dependent transferase [Bradyrhizobium sp. RDM4]|uniref:PLP-dependent transferase n=1 Tax=Bradyrhizobium sp. RDM4 TaxID=3378765 RepID=UPI0038FC55B7